MGKAATSPDAPDPTFGITLIRAAELLGGVDVLSKRLYVSRLDLLSWMAGNGEPPIRVFLRAVEILIEFLPQVPMDHDPDSARHPLLR